MATPRKLARRPVEPPPDATLEQLAEHRRREELMDTAALAADMVAVRNATVLPEGPELSRIARHLRRNPGLARHPAMELYLNACLDRLVADYPPPTPTPDAKAIMVEFWRSGKNAVSLGEARDRVAKLWGAAVLTVKEAHLQYLRRWGKK